MTSTCCLNCPTSPNCAPGSSAASISFTHDANEPSLTPNDSAIWYRGRSELRNSSTASRRNSSGYFDGRPIRASPPLDSIQDQVSTEPGQLQSADGSEPALDELDVADSQDGEQLRDNLTIDAFEFPRSNVVLKVFPNERTRGHSGQRPTTLV